MDTNTHEGGLLLKEEVYRLVGCALDVLNEVGHGFHEKPYENALVVEFEIQRIPFSQQPIYPILYKGQKVGEYVPDLIAFDAIVIDTKVIQRITDHERGSDSELSSRQAGLGTHRFVELAFVSIRVHSWLIIL